MWERLRQPLSAKQVASAVGLLVLVGAVFYGIYSGAAAAWHRYHLVKLIPPVLDGVRGQREVLLRAIEAYKTRFGYYPPLFTKPGPDRGVMNPLCYELVGVQFEPKKASFRISITKDPMTVDEAQKYFNARSFSNCVNFPDNPVDFMSRSLPVYPLTPDGEVFGVSLGYPNFTPEGFWQDFEFSPWRYLTNPAEHNPGKFDLWIEVKVAGRHFTIGNWQEVK